MTLATTPALKLNNGVTIPALGIGRLPEPARGDVDRGRDGAARSAIAWSTRPPPTTTSARSVRASAAPAFPATRSSSPPSYG